MPELDVSGVKIYLVPSHIWKFFVKSHDRLQAEMVLVAENLHTQYAVYIDADNDVLRIHVCKGDNHPEYTQVIVDEEQCAASATRLYRQYLFPIVVTEAPATPDDSDGHDLTQQDMEDMQYEREDELQLAMADFLAVALEADLDIVLNDMGEGEIEDIVDHILQYLAENHGISVYRPMFIEDEETGNEVFCEYPYEGYIEDENMGEQGACNDVWHNI